MDKFLETERRMAAARGWEGDGEALPNEDGFGSTR